MDTQSSQSSQTQVKLSQKHVWHYVNHTQKFELLHRFRLKGKNQGYGAVLTMEVQVLQAEM